MCYRLLMSELTPLETTSTNVGVTWDYKLPLWTLTYNGKLLNLLVVYAVIIKKNQLFTHTYFK
jgi:hypothetical protein